MTGKTQQAIFGSAFCHRLHLLSAATALAGAVVQTCLLRKAAKDADTSLAGEDGKNYVTGPVLERDDNLLC